MKPDKCRTFPFAWTNADSAEICPGLKALLLSLANTWVADSEADKALDEMRTIDADLWK